MHPDNHVVLTFGCFVPLSIHDLRLYMVQKMETNKHWKQMFDEWTCAEFDTDDIEQNFWTKHRLTQVVKLCGGDRRIHLLETTNGTNSVTQYYICLKRICTIKWGFGGSICFLLNNKKLGVMDNALGTMKQLYNTPTNEEVNLLNKVVLNLLARPVAIGYLTISRFV
jgi:hypothetical protein